MAGLISSITHLVTGSKHLAEGAAHAAANVATDGLCGKGTSQAFAMLGELRKELAFELFPDHNPRHYFITNAAMIVKQCCQEDRHKDPLDQYKDKGKAFHDPEVFRKAARYAAYADAVYYMPDKAVICEHLEGLSPDDIKAIEYCVEVDKPNWMITVDPVTDEIVLAIRGTNNVTDAMTDLNARNTEYLGGYAHTGMLESARVIHEQCREKMLELVTTTNKKVAVVGHSLGGGTAVLTMIKLFGEELGKMAAKEAAKTVHCWAFAPPPVFGPPSALPKWAANCITTFVNNFDMVPRACLHTCVKFFKAERVVDDLEIGAKDRMSYLHGTHHLPEDVHCPDHVPLSGEEAATYKGLHGTGRILLFHWTEEGNTACVHVHHDHFDRLFFHADMLNNHMMTGYIEHLNNCLEMEAPPGWLKSSMKSFWGGKKEESPKKQGTKEVAEGEAAPAQ